MVQDNSQLAPINSLAMEIDMFRSEPVLIQLIHNTDDDNLILLIIKDFNQMKIKEFAFAKLNSANRFILEERYGFSNQNIVQSSQTFLTSLEFRSLLKEIMLEKLKCIEDDEKDKTDQK